MDPNLRQRVFSIIERAVRINPETLDPNRDIRDQVSLDSMQFVALSATIEKELDIELPLEVMEVRNINEFLRIVEDAIDA